MASTSRASSGAAYHRGVANAGSVRPVAPPAYAPSADTSTRRALDHTATADRAPSPMPARAGEALPAGNPHVAGDTAHLPTSVTPRDTVDLTTPPDGEEYGGEEEVDAAKLKPADRRRTNKQAQASFAKEMKDSLAAGRPPQAKRSEDQALLKARWHSAAKDCAYRLLDLTKNSWRDYTLFDKTRVHNELNDRYGFDPPIDPKRVDAYLSAHLRSSRAVWKTHWLRNGDEDRHPNCPEEAWEQLIKWWPTEACASESALMAGKRSLVQNRSKYGRKRLVQRMDEKVNSLLAHSMIWSQVCLIWPGSPG